MKYVSLDLETTCLDPSPSHILMVSMVVEDTKNILPLTQLPHFTCFVRPDGPIVGAPMALWMNGWILKLLVDKVPNAPFPIYSETIWPSDALRFLNEHFGPERVVAAGKNVSGFDLKFVPTEIANRFHHRVVDPGSMFLDWNIDAVPPDSKVCKERSGLEGIVTHNAYEDAIDIIRILRTRYVARV